MRYAVNLAYRWQPLHLAARVAYVRTVKLIAVSLGVVVALAGCGPATTSGPTTGAPHAHKRLLDVDANGVALGGYDPIAYGRYGKPVTGVPEHSLQYDGATYRFSSPAHMLVFDGKEHAPLYGGYCAYMVAQGRLTESNPLAFSFHAGKLLVFTNAELRDLFNQDPAGNKAKADAMWPALVQKHGK